MVNLKELLNEFKAKGLTLEENISFKETNRGRRFDVGYIRYELVLYKDVKLDKGWKTTMVRVIPKTNNINEFIKVIPNAEELLKSKSSKNTE